MGNSTSNQKNKTEMNNNHHNNNNNKTANTTKPSICSNRNCNNLILALLALYDHWNRRTCWQFVQPQLLALLSLLLPSLLLLLPSFLLAASAAAAAAAVR